MYVLTVDMGTTNSRIYLMKDYICMDSVCAPVGARDAAVSGDTAVLKDTLRGLIRAILEKNRLCETDVHSIVAGGMITSELGLCCIPHIQTPVGIRELSRGIRKMSMEEVTSIPICFVPGVKNSCSPGDIDSLDMMRGEEIELMGILELTKTSGPLVAVLPGSHAKIIAVNEKNEILECQTTMSGEIISALSQNTILRQSLPIDKPDSLQNEFLLQGFQSSRKNGINRAAF